MLLLAGLAGLFFLPEPWNVIVVAVAAVIEAGEVWFWIRFLRRYRVSTGAEGMVGQRGEAIDGFGPAATGRVRVYGEIWAARSRAPLEPGGRVRVLGVEGLTLEIEPEAPPGTEKGP